MGNPKTQNLISELEVALSTELLPHIPNVNGRYVIYAAGNDSVDTTLELKIDSGTSTTCLDIDQGTFVTTEIPAQRGRTYTFKTGSAAQIHILGINFESNN